MWRSGAQDDSDDVNILVVDDLSTQHVVLRTVLEEPGQNVVAVSSGREALRAVLEQSFAVILLDVNMPDMDGFETASMLRSYKPTATTPIIFITAYVDDSEMTRGYALGAVDYISSPVVPEILRAKVRVFVQMYRMNRALVARADEREALAKAQAQRAAADEARRRADFLSSATHALTRSLDVDTTIARILDISVPVLADLACVWLADGPAASPRTQTRFIVPPHDGVASRHERPDAFVRMMPLPAFHELARQALDSGQPVNSRGDLPAVFTPRDAASPAPRFYELTLYPLLLGAGRQAVIAFGALEPDEGRLPAPVCSEFVSRAAIALENAFLFSAIRNEDQRKNEFLAMLAHELRNPLAPIANAVRVMRGAKDDDTSVVSWSSEIIGTQIEHMVRIVDDLLDVSRIARGTVALRREPVSLRTAVMRAIETSRPHFNARSQFFSYDCGADDAVIDGDVVRLTQIVANLLNNASKFTPPGGNISLATEFSKGMATITVSDDGAGIEPALLPHVFDLFAQGDSSLDRAQGGLGIGLTLARNLAELHGGTVHCSSAGEGRGAQFVVHLPARVDNAAEARRHNVVPLYRKPGLRVLVVDDVAASAESLEIFLEMQGYEVRTASDGPTALAAAHAFMPHIAVLDIGLPGMNGYEVARALRADDLLRTCLIIALSGYGQEEDRRASAAAGIDHHLVKPADLDFLLELMATYGTKQDASESIDGQRAR
jgi:signal transduction histidine kinase/DNA-binding response OmpR family regulator